MKWSILDVVSLYVLPKMASSGGYIYRPPYPLKKPLSQVPVTSSRLWSDALDTAWGAGRNASGPAGG